MGLVFRKSIKLFKGVKLNISKSGPSLSFGKTGMRATVGANGKVTGSVGIPGTGVYYRKTANVKKLVEKTKDKEEKKKAKTSKKEEKQNNGSISLEEYNARRKGAESLASENNEDMQEYEAYVQSMEDIVSVHKTADPVIDWDNVSGKDMLELKESVMNGDIDSYLYVIGEMQPFDDLLEYGSEFEVGEDQNEGEIAVEFHVKSEEVVPEEELDINAGGQIVVKKMAAGKRNELIKDYVCSCVLRVARDTFSMLPIDVVNVYALDKVLNTATGNEEDVCIVKARISRSSLYGINFEKVDPSDCLDNIGCEMKYSKTKGFRPLDD